MGYTIDMEDAILQDNGWMISFHPKPDDVEPPEWFKQVRLAYVEEGRIVRNVLAAIEYEYDDPSNTLYRKVIGQKWGVEVEWTV